MGVINNKESLERSSLRKDVVALIEAGMEAVDTRSVLERDVRLQDTTLLVRDRSFSLRGIERLLVVAIGKAALDASIALEHVLGDRLDGGVLLDICPMEPGLLDTIECFQGDHPMPTQRNVDATRRILSVLGELTESDMVLVVVSGGGSTLLCQPDDGTCQEEEVLLNTLFKVGATIQEINTVRKHISAARGGNLAKAAYPAQVISLIFSDVPGDDLQFIASGPTVKDTTTIEDAKAILKKYVITGDEGIRLWYLRETPSDDKYFRRVTNILFVSNAIVLAAMATAAEDRGYTQRIVSSTMRGEARDVGKHVAMELRASSSKTALLYGGETTVTITGDGKGGRNQEVALGALPYLREGQLVASFASDGHDNTDHAGALCDILTKEKAKEHGLDPGIALADNNSYAFFEQTGDAIVTGRTGCNVSDIIIGLTE